MKDKFKALGERIVEQYRRFDGFLAKMNNRFLSWFHDHDLLLFVLLVTILGVLMRVLLFPCVRGDYTSFLLPWYTNIYENGADALGK